MSESPWQHWPWSVGVSSWTGKWAVIDTRGTIVEEFTTEADARLFASAPELYDALCLVASDLEVLMQIKDNEVIRKIQAALLKADPNVLEARHDG